MNSTKNARSWWSPGRWGMLLAAVGLALVGSFFFRSPATAASLTSDGTPATGFDTAGQNTVTVTAHGIPEGSCDECPTKSVVVTYNSANGSWGVSPNDSPPVHSTGSDHDSSTTSSKDSNTTPPTTTTSDPTVDTGTTTGQGNRTGNATAQKNATKGMIDAAKAAYNALNPPRPDKAANVDGSFTITVTWKVPCPEGHGDGLCKYTVTLTVFLDNAGAVTGASATGS